MVRVISQETYDETVRENMEEFSMTAEEAIHEAIEQFNAQGVDLSNIIKDLALSDNSNNILTAIKKLKECTKNPKYEHVTSVLNKLKLELEKDIARRVFAGKNGAYSVLIDLINSCSEEASILRLALKTITLLMTGNPDLLDNVGIDLQKKLIANNTNDPQTLLLILKWIRECCIKHEINRQKIFQAGILESLKVILKDKDTNVSVLKEACVLLRTLTLDDDFRHEFGKAHEHASAIARNTLQTLTELLSIFQTDKIVVGEIMLTLASLIVRNEFCKEFEEAGGLQYILDVFTNYPDVEKINWQALKLLKNLAGNDEVKSRIITSGCAPLIIYAISRLRNSETVVSTGLACISALTLKSPSNAGVFYDCGAVPIIIDAIKAHPLSLNVFQQASWAVRNMSVRNKQESREFIAYGIEDLFKNALKIHGEKLESDAKAALRDLGLKVELKEIWTGKGVSLSNEV